MKTIDRIVDFLHTARRTAKVVAGSVAIVAAASGASAVSADETASRAQQRAGLTIFEQVTDYNLGPSEEVVRGINVQTGASFSGWRERDQIRTFPARIGARYGWALGDETTVSVFAAKNPLEGRLKGEQTVVGQFGPQTANLDWRTSNYQIGVGVDRSNITAKAPDLTLGLDIYAFHVDSNVKTGLQIPAVAVTTGMSTSFSDSSLAWRVHASHPVGTYHGNTLTVTLGYEHARVSGQAKGTALNPTATPGDATVVPVSIPATDKFDGVFLSLGMKYR